MSITIGSFIHAVFVTFQKSFTMKSPHRLKNWAWAIPAFLLFACQSAPKTNTPDTPAEQDSLYAKYHLDKIKLPPGFSISVYATVPNARSLCWGSKGVLFVGNKDDKNVYAITDTDKNGKADSVYTIATGLTMPNGVAFRDGSLYVAEISRIIRFDSIDGATCGGFRYALLHG